VKAFRSLVHELYKMLKGGLPTGGLDAYLSLLTVNGTYVSADRMPPGTRRAP